MTRLFDSDQAENVRRKAKGLGRLTCPLAYWVVSADEAAGERDRLSAMCAKVPPEHQADVRSRLLSKDDATHLACLFELEAWQFFDRREDWLAEYQPSTTFGTPDVRTVAPNGQVFYVEALTTFESAERASRSRRERYFLEQLDRIESYYLVNVKSISVEPTAKPSDFGRFIEAKLNALRQLSTAAGDPIELEYRADDAFVLLTVIPTDRTEPGPVLVGHGAEVRYLPPAPFRDRMKAKVEKYARVVDDDAALMLAVGVTELVFRGHGVVNSMYGTEQVSFQLDRHTGAQISDPTPTRDFDSGLLWSSRHGSQAPHLSGALEIGLKWTAQRKTEVREPAFGFIRNVFSPNAVEPELFADLPQFALPGDTADTFVNEWGRWEDGAVRRLGRH